MNETLQNYIRLGVLPEKLVYTESPSTCIWSLTRQCLVGTNGIPAEEVVNDSKGMRLTVENNRMLSLQVRSTIDVDSINKSNGIVVTDYEPYFRFAEIPAPMLNLKNSQPKLKVRFKKLREDVVIPKYSKDGDAGCDLVATHIESDTPEKITYGTGLAVEIPYGYVGLIFPRSSVRDTNLSLSNCVGVIDSGYRGEIKATFYKLAGFEGYYDETITDLQTTAYTPGSRIMQIIIVPFPHIEWVESETLSDSQRGENGFGHTGN